MLFFTSHSLRRIRWSSAVSALWYPRKVLSLLQKTQSGRWKHRSLSSSHLRLQTGDVPPKNKVSLSSQRRRRRKKKSTFGILLFCLFVSRLLCLSLIFTETFYLWLHGSEEEDRAWVPVGSSFRLGSSHAESLVVGGSHLTSTVGKEQESHQWHSCRYLGFFFLLGVGVIWLFFFAGGVQFVHAIQTRWENAHKTPNCSYKSPI